MPRKQKSSRMSQKDWDQWGEKMGKKWASKWADPEMWERRSRRGKIGFGVFLLLVGLIWLLMDMGYITNIPLWPMIVILFAIFVLLTRA